MQRVETKRWEREIAEYIRSYSKKSEAAKSICANLGGYFKHIQEETNISHNTLRIRYFCLSVFEKWLKTNEINEITKVTEKVIREYLSYCICSRKQGHSTLKCTKVAEKVENPTQNMSVSTRPVKREFEILSPSEMISVIRAAKESYADCMSRSRKNKRHIYYTLRDTAILMVLSATGIRTGELCAIKLSDIDTANGSIEINGKGNHIYLTRHRKVYIDIPEVINAINDYIEVRPNSEMLFCSYEGEPTANYAVISAMKKLAVKAGINRNITPLAFRHTVCSAMTHNGAYPYSVKEFMGHKKLLTTLHYYTHFNHDQLRSQNASFNPLKGGI